MSTQVFSSKQKKLEERHLENLRTKARRRGRSLLTRVYLKGLVVKEWDYRSGRVSWLAQMPKPEIHKVYLVSGSVFLPFLQDVATVREEKVKKPQAQHTRTQVHLSSHPMHEIHHDCIVYILMVNLVHISKECQISF